jgi:hypothetical protein
LDLLTQTAKEAQSAAELPQGTDAEQLAFEISALLAGTNLTVVLHSDNAAIDRARRAIQNRLYGGESPLSGRTTAGGLQQLSPRFESGQLHRSMVGLPCCMGNGGVRRPLPGATRPAVLLRRARSTGPRKK